ncbi:MAG: hypothetical protein K6T66_09620 [Peptococcaceae bacterium]|nr:hypothetical protein [Peptococcaceae bacterium]
MIKIGDELIERKDSIEETMKALRLHLHNNKIIIVDENDVPCTDDQIIALMSNDYVEFKTKPIVQLEKETIFESISCTEKLEKKMADMLDSDNPNEVFKYFPGILESLLELAKICKYFNSPIIKQEKIIEYARKSVVQMEENNDNYLREITEYEFIPMISEFKKFLLRGKANC